VVSISEILLCLKTEAQGPKRLLRKARNLDVFIEVSLFQTRGGDWRICASCTADACGVELKTVKFTRKIWQYLKDRPVSLNLSNKQSLIRLTTCVLAK
jgi:hypothetical protein